MSPILTRPVREQLEHDRVIRQLQAKYKRKTDVIINPGNEKTQSVMVGDRVEFPDLLVFGEGTRRLLVTVEVETGESVNHIEAQAEWGVYSKLKVPLHLYVPTACVDAARRICAEYQILVSELWSYTATFDQVRFTLVDKSPDAPTVRLPSTLRPAQGRPAPKAAASSKSKPSPRKAAKARPAAKAKPKAKPAARKATTAGRGRGAKPRVKIKKR